MPNIDPGTFRHRLTVVLGRASTDQWGIVDYDDNPVMRVDIFGFIKSLMPRMRSSSQTNEPAAILHQVVFFNHPDWEINNINWRIYFHDAMEGRWAKVVEVIDPDGMNAYRQVMAEEFIK